MDGCLTSLLKGVTGAALNTLRRRAGKRHVGRLEEEKKKNIRCHFLLVHLGRTALVGRGSVARVAVGAAAATLELGGTAARKLGSHEIVCFHRLFFVFWMEKVRRDLTRLTWLSSPTRTAKVGRVSTRQEVWGWVGTERKKGARRGKQKTKNTRVRGAHMVPMIFSVGTWDS